jgi:hypothetical protein
LEDVLIRAGWFMAARRAALAFGRTAEAVDPGGNMAAKEAIVGLAVKRERESKREHPGRG